MTHEPKRVDWTSAIDRLLTLVEGMSAREASERFGVSAEAISVWRRRRRGGERIVGIRGGTREAVERFLDGCYPTSRIPIGGRAAYRRRVCTPRVTE